MSLTSECEDGFRWMVSHEHIVCGTRKPHTCLGPLQDQLILLWFCWHKGIATSNKG